MIDYHQWQPCHHDDEPRDQQIDFSGPFWAQVGPDTRQHPDGWSWTIMDCDMDTSCPEVASGFADSEAEVKRECERVGRRLSGHPTLWDILCGFLS